MDKADLVALISTRSHKLKAIRQQTANGNQEKKKLYMAALVFLLEERRTQPPAYEQITELLATASPFIANAIEQQLVPSIIRLHSQPALNDYIILWGRMCDGTLAKKEYPDFRERFERLKIKNIEKDLSPVFKNYLLQFQKNFNQRNDQRVQFFQDFDDSVSQSIDNESQLMNVIYLSIMEVKAARKKLEEQKLPDEALNEQLTKLKHFLSLRLPNYLSEHERQEFEKEKEWAKGYLEGKVEEKQRNPSVSLSQTLILQGQEEQIQIVKDEPKPRLFRSKNPLSRQFFEDDLQFSEKKDNFKKLRGGLPGQPHHDSLPSPTPIKKINPRYSGSGQVHHDSFPSPTPVKYLDPRYSSSGKPEISQNNSSLQINNGRNSQVYKNFQEPIQEQKEDIIEEELVLHKIKPGQFQPLKAKPLPDFSVTENYFKKSNHQFLSPKSPKGGVNSRTVEGWGQSGQLTHSRCKLSKFTSEKKVRKELAPRSELTVAEPHVIQPYLQHFSNLTDYARFRRNCFENNYTLHTSQLLTVACFTEKQVDSKVRLELTFINNDNMPLQVEVIYKVPQCFSIQKKSKIAKRFQLHSTLKHVFCLGVEEFPLEPSILSLKTRSADGEASEEVFTPFPLTLINFIQYLYVSDDEWVKEWTSLNGKENQQCYFFAKHIQMDRHVSGDEIDWLLKDLFVRVAAIEGYSVQDYGCICFYPDLHNLRFLVHLSVRVDNIVSLEASSSRLVTKDEREFIDYCMNLWMMLLGKLYL